MREQPGVHSGIVVVSVWWDDPRPDRLRARITTEVGLDNRTRTVSVAAGIDEISLALRESLERLAPRR